MDTMDTGSVHSMSDSYAAVLDDSGHAERLSTFLTHLLKGSELGIAEIARRAHLSRSFLYLLMDDEQVPSVESLVAVFEAAGCTDVRAADPGEPGEIAFTWLEHERWVRLPADGKRAARSRATLRTLNSSQGSRMTEPPPPSSRRQSAAPSGAVAMSYDLSVGSAPPSPASDRQQLLGELLDSAGDLDPDRLRLLVEHARLLGRA